MKLRALVRYLRKAHEAWSVISVGLGWRRSYSMQRPVDADGQAIPWYTYPALEFLRSLDFSGKKVFEYGCGNSSIYWASRAAEVVAVENNAEWAAIVRGFGITNLSLHEAANRDDYVSTPINVSSGGFDVVVIDGRYRRECVKPACEVVRSDGFIIFDNADWYPDACADLRSRGWFEVKFSGLGPLAPFQWTTSVFLKSNANFGAVAGYQPIACSTPVWQEDD